MPGMHLEALLLQAWVAKPPVESTPRPRAGSQTRGREELGLAVRGAVETGQLRESAETPPAELVTRAREDAAARPRAGPMPRPLAGLATRAPEAAAETARAALGTHPAAEPQVIR